jgi:tripartite-type tricarboxylate transporter receptor subunit TctC
MIRAAACLLTLLAVPAPGQAQTAYPNRPVKLVIPFPAGGINDVLARIIGDKLQAKWGQPIIIENKTGAGGNIGTTRRPMATPGRSRRRARCRSTRPSTSG